MYTATEMAKRDIVVPVATLPSGYALLSEWDVRTTEGVLWFLPPPLPMQILGLNQWG